MKNELHFWLQIRISGRHSFFGPGPAALLRLVEKTGSLAQAAAGMDLSYSKAQKMVKRMEAEAGEAFMERHTGGARGGSSELTDFARRFLAAYTRFEAQMLEKGEALFRECFAGVGGAP